MSGASCRAARKQVKLLLPQPIVSETRRIQRACVLGMDIFPGQAQKLRSLKDHGAPRFRK